MKKILILIVTLISMAAFVGIILRGSIYSPEEEITPPNALSKIEEQQAKLPGHSSRLFIPILKIDAQVQEVGITKKGNIGAPNNFTDVGWYKYGPLPGNSGTAVIGGHIDNGFSFPGVFKKLNDISIGDDVYIETKEGDTLHFVVKNITTYDYNSPTESIFAKSDEPTLLLITCTGNWVNAIRTHDKRLVVTTVLSKK